MKGWAFHYMENRKGASALIAALAASLAVLQGPKRGGGRSPGAPIFFPRSPEPHRFVAWSPNIILL